MTDPVEQLAAAGRIASIARVGHPPLGGDDSIEIAFESGALFHVDVGFEGASDIRIGSGSVLETAFGHLRDEEPETWNAIARSWEREAAPLPWLIGATLSNPRRLTMTYPYRLDVGYAFDAGSRTFALFGESDYIFATELNDPEIASFELEVGEPERPYSAA